MFIFCDRIGGRENFFHCSKCGKLLVLLFLLPKILAGSLCVIITCVYLSNFAYHIFDYEGCCYSILLKNSHPCVEGAMHHDCPVCFEVIHASFLSFSSWCNICSAWSKLNCKHDNMLICSIYSSQEMMWLFCHVVTLFTNTAWRKCGIIFSECWHCFSFFLFLL